MRVASVRVRPGQRLSRKSPISLSTHPLPPPFPDFSLFHIGIIPVKSPWNIHNLQSNLIHLFTSRTCGGLVVIQLLGADPKIVSLPATSGDNRPRSIPRQPILTIANVEHRHQNHKPQTTTLIFSIISSFPHRVLVSS